jgi:DNA repair protein radc
MNMKTINCKEDSPVYKAIEKGFQALNNSELLATVLGNNNVNLTQQILKSCDYNFGNLAKIGVDELCQFKGVGYSTAIAIMAAFEIGKRRQQEEIINKNIISCSTDIYKIFHPVLCDLSTEECWILLLNQGNRVIDRIKISAGGIAETSVDIRFILREAILKRAVSIALIHNHPSGNIKPSCEDDRLTQRVRESGKVMNINLVDHIIITDGRYYSYADEGRI